MRRGDSTNMSERKNIKRNRNRVRAKDRPFHSSMQRNYNTKVIPKSEGNGLQMQLTNLK